MEKNQILKADMLDILFEGRNKSYGAYQLRRSYNKRLKIAISVTMACCLFIFLVSVMAKNKEQGKYTPDAGPDVFLKSVDPSEPVIPPPPPLPPPVVHEIARIKFTTLVLTTENVEVSPPLQTDVDKIAIGLIDNKNGASMDIIAPPIEPYNIGKVETPVKDDFKNEVFFVQKEAQFPGGMYAWKKFLEKNLQSDLPAQNGATTGVFSVVVSFLVDREGNISEVEALNNPGFGTAAEAVRVVRRGSKWIPAMQNGQNVIYRQKQTITFMVEGD